MQIYDEQPLSFNMHYLNDTVTSITNQYWKIFVKKNSTKKHFNYL